MNSASTRVWSFATVLLIIVVVALGWFLGISPKLAEAARFDSDRLAVQAQNEVTRAAIAQLEADFERIEELRSELALLRAEFPTQAEYDDAVQEFITTILAEDLVLQNLQINEPSPTTAAVLGPDEVVPEPEIDGTGVLPAGSLLLVSVSITVFGPLDATLAFIDELQRSPRFGVIPTATFAADGGDGGGETTITLNIYVISGEDLVEVPPVPEPEPTATPTPGATDPAATPTPGAPTPTPTP
ncbi:hypothetical protein [Microcella frigidaquae]|uniref:Tfp pilus assembly protein PilO n=1 Tax=Microcella frigidaquae TaxID=424758 RepID=A0A840X9D3_9MICO|nr:hypothetical protein [Microcella frigidaquae]MBB5617804.1 hypothetical protein [Microcella frigidaquae]